MSGPYSLEPPSGGTIFRFFEIPPQDPSLSPEQAERAAAEAFAAAGASHCRVDTRRNPMMHTTSSIDYVVVLKGRVRLLLDADQVELSPFDVVVQRGTNHYWLNYGSEPALLMGVLLDALGRKGAAGSWVRQSPRSEGMRLTLVRSRFPRDLRLTP